MMLLSRFRDRYIAKNTKISKLKRIPDRDDFKRQRTGEDTYCKYTAKCTETRFFAAVFLGEKILQDKGNKLSTSFCKGV